MLLRSFRIFCTIVFAATFVAASAARTPTKLPLRMPESPIIKAIENQSAFAVAVALQGRKIDIPAYHSYPSATTETAAKFGKLQKKLAKLACLKKIASGAALVVPKVSLTSVKYHDQIIGDEPYFPDEALQLTVKDIEYAIWQDETGVMFARKFAPGMLRGECLPQVLFKLPLIGPGPKINQSSTRLFALIVTQLGELELEECATPSE